MNMAINVYEYGRGGKCLCMFRYTYAAIKIINMQIEKGDRHRNWLCVHQGHRDKGIYGIRRRKKNQKVVISTKLNADHKIEEDIHT